LILFFISTIRAPCPFHSTVLHSKTFMNSAFFTQIYLKSIHYTHHPVHKQPQPICFPRSE
jgi:hypothetical protein